MGPSHLNSVSVFSRTFAEPLKQRGEAGAEGQAEGRQHRTVAEPLGQRSEVRAVRIIIKVNNSFVQVKESVILTWF